MKSFTVFSLFTLCGSALCAPSPENELNARSANGRASVTAIISILSQYKAPATSFCSSFISIPVKTVTSTNIVTSTSKTSTVIQTKTITPKMYQNDIESYRSITATTTITPTVAPILTQTVTFPFRKRDAPPIPSYLTTFPGSEISSACSCLSITPSTTTVRATSTVVVKSIVTVQTTITKPTITTTAAEVIVTASTTVTECAYAEPTIILKLTTPVIINGTQLLDTYGVVHVDYEDIGTRVDRFAFNGDTNPLSAGALIAGAAGTPAIIEGYESGFIAVRLGNETGVKALHFEDPELLNNITPPNDTPDSCLIDSASGGFTCTRDDGASIWQLCPETKGFNDLFIGPTVGTGCSEVAINAIPVCTPPPAS